MLFGFALRLAKWAYSVILSVFHFFLIHNMNAKNYRRINLYINSLNKADAIHLLINLKSQGVNVYSEFKLLFRDIKAGRYNLNFFGASCILSVYPNSSRVPKRCHKYGFNVAARFCEPPF